ncbi:MAG: hypothetical protein OEX00_02280 [Gammaproteobacteria bacterium]|nr:hypothetical protein [Gammaproteobacteria bacterium]MDH5693592.1 hypothetical protein [Gammaproteobacteria bacterium]
MNVKTIIFVLLTIAVSACSFPQDEGISVLVPFSFKTAGNPLAFAFVYIDENNNASFDPWEQSAYTDKDGYVSRNDSQDTPIRYCDFPREDIKFSHCLKVQNNKTGVNIRVSGGFDVWTGMPFTGEYVLFSTLDPGLNDKILLLTPSRAFLDFYNTNNGIRSPEEVNFLNKINLGEEVFTSDYTDFSQNPDPNRSTHSQFRSFKISSLFNVMSQVVSRGMEAYFPKDQNKEVETPPNFISWANYTFFNVYKLEPDRAPVETFSEIDEAKGDPSLLAVSNLLDALRRTYKGLNSGEKPKIEPGSIAKRTTFSAEAVASIFKTDLSLNNTTLTSSQAKVRHYLVDLTAKIHSYYQYLAFQNEYVFSSMLKNFNTFFLSNRNVHIQLQSPRKADYFGFYNRIISNQVVFSDILFNFPDLLTIQDLTDIDDGSSGLSGLDGVEINLFNEVGKSKYDVKLNFVEDNVDEGFVTISIVNLETGETSSLGGPWVRFNDHAFGLFVKHQNGLLEPLVFSWGNAAVLNEVNEIIGFETKYILTLDNNLGFWEKSE